MQNSYNNSQAAYAGFWVRAAAYIIDSVIVFSGLLIVRLLMSGVMALAEGTYLAGNILFSYTLKDIVLYIAQVLYFVLCTYFTGTTLGKRAMNLRVVSAGEQEKLTMLNVIYRETVGRFLSGIILEVGYIIAGIDPQKRALHDILCDTRVVYAKKIKVYPVYQRPAAAAPMPTSGPAPIQPETRPPMGPYNMVKPEAVQPDMKQNGENKESGEQDELQ